MNWVLIVGLLLNLVLLPIAARRVVWLYRLITSGQPDPGRVEGVTGRVGQTVRTQLVEVFAQRKLLKWTVPGSAHLFVFWALPLSGHSGSLLWVLRLVCWATMEHCGQSVDSYLTPLRLIEHSSTPTTPFHAIRHSAHPPNSPHPHNPQLPSST